jgi:hypothetical protein
MNGTQGTISSGGSGNSGVSIFLTLPKTEKNKDNYEFSVASNQYAGNLPRTAMNQAINFTVGMLPTTQSLLSKIKESNPTIMLFRKTTKVNSSDKLKKGYNWVHPSPVNGGSAINTAHRFHAGNHSTTTAERITEFQITNPDFEFYTSIKGRENGMTFEFKPLMWFNQDVYRQRLEFPQAIFNPLAKTPFVSSIQSQRVADTSNNIFTYVSGKRNGRLNPAKYFWGVQLWIDNPDYDNTTNTPRRIPISNMVEFTMGYKTVIASNDDGDLMRYAIDWHFNLDQYNR